MCESLPETHRQGVLTIENESIIGDMEHANCYLGVQVSEDGRVWVCVNGVAWIRFRPHA